MQILDDLGYILETNCLTPEALEGVVGIIRKEPNLLPQEDSTNVVFFNQVLALCAEKVACHLRRELTVDERIFIGPRVYAYLMSRGKV
jgi:hypothetical protein